MNYHTWSILLPGGQPVVALQAVNGPLLAAVTTQFRH